MPLHRDIHALYDESLNRLESDMHTSIRPYRIDEVGLHAGKDSIWNSIYFHDYQKNKGLQDWVYRKLRRESFLFLDSAAFQVSADPLLHFQMGREVNNQRNTYVNTRGFLLKGNLGKKFSFYTSFYENQSVFPTYIDAQIHKNTVVPGQGIPKLFKNGFDYAMSTGYISYTPSRFVNFQFGNDKNFIGDGYRSLLLSDNSFNYPFFKITTTFWKIRYMNLYTQFTDIRAPHIFENGYRKKYGNFHYLDFNVRKRFSVGIFEAVIWQNSDSAGGRGFEWGYLNPVIFYRPVEFSVGSPDNALMGLNFKFKINDKNLLYSQVMIDEFLLKEVRAGKGWYANKQAFQLGMKNFHLFGVNNLNFQTELNYVRPFTYGHERVITNYAHYNQALAHPLNANFIESVSFLRYRYKSFFAEVKFMYALHGADTAGRNLGNDLYQPYSTAYSMYGNYLGNGLKTHLTYNDIRIVYIVNPKTNLNIELGFSNRMSKNSLKTDISRYVYFGIRTSLQNFYYDF